MRPAVFVPPVWDHLDLETRRLVMRSMFFAMAVAALAAPAAWAQRDSSPDLNREIRQLRSDMRQFEARLRALERRLGSPGDGPRAEGSPGFERGMFRGGFGGGAAPFGGGGGFSPAGGGSGGFGGGGIARMGGN